MSTEHSRIFLKGGYKLPVFKSSSVTWSATHWNILRVALEFLSSLIDKNTVDQTIISQISSEIRCFEEISTFQPILNRPEQRWGKVHRWCGEFRLRWHREQRQGKCRRCFPGQVWMFSLRTWQVRTGSQKRKSLGPSNKSKLIAVNLKKCFRNSSQDFSWIFVKIQLISKFIKLATLPTTNV